MLVAEDKDMKELLVPIFSAMGGALSGVVGTLVTQRHQTARQQAADAASVTVAKITQEDAFQARLSARIAALEARVDHLEEQNDQLRSYIMKLENEKLALQTENERLKASIR